MDVPYARTTSANVKWPGVAGLTVGDREFADSSLEEAGFELPVPPAVHLIGFGDRRKPHDFPGLLRVDVADEIVFVQPLHDDDDDDGAAPFVVLPAVERVV